MAKMSQVQFYNEPVEKQLGFAASVQTGNTIRMSGVISVDKTMAVVAPGDMTGQINQIYSIIEETLALSNATFENVVREMIYVTDMQAFAEAGSVRAEKYTGVGLPAATVAQISALFMPEIMVEIEVTAVVD